MKILLTDKAKNDIKKATEWYNIQQDKLGELFLESLDQSLQNLLSFPEMYPVCYLNFRRCLVKRFPFSVFYTIEKENIIIHAILNNRQNPQKWPV